MSLTVVRPLILDGDKREALVALYDSDCIFVYWCSWRMLSALQNMAESALSVEGHAHDNGLGFRESATTGAVRRTERRAINSGDRSAPSNIAGIESGSA